MRFPLKEGQSPCYLHVPHKFLDTFHARFCWDTGNKDEEGRHILELNQPKFDKEAKELGCLNEN